MKSIKMAIFATSKHGNSTDQNLTAQALLLKNHGKKTRSLECEIHIGEMVTRFTPSDNFFLEDLLWQLNDYCHIPYNEIKCDLHYPEPSLIEDEFGEEICADMRINLSHQLKESNLSFKALVWPGLNVDDKILDLRNSGVDIDVFSTSNYKSIAI